MNNFDYIRPGDITEAVKAISANDKAVFIAGGTNLIDLWKYNLANPELLVDLNGVNSNHSIEEKEDGGLRLGAFVTNADTAYHPLIESRYPLLSKAILAGASAQIRNMATNGGNLLQRTRCYYFYDPDVPCNKRKPGSGCSALEGYNRIHAVLGASRNCIAVFPSDMCIALAALEATVQIQGTRGTRKIAFGDFHLLPGSTPHRETVLEPGDLITHITLPPPTGGSKHLYLKLRDRASYEFALASAAVVLTISSGKISRVRIALGGVGTKPWRSTEAEAALIGKTANDASFRQAAEAALQGARPQSENRFKIELAKRCLTHALRTAAAS